MEKVQPGGACPLAQNRIEENFGPQELCDLVRIGLLCGFTELLSPQPVLTPIERAVSYDGKAEKFFLNDEQAFTLAGVSGHTHL